MITRHSATNIGRLIALVGTVVVGLSLVFALGLSARPAVAQLNISGETARLQGLIPPAGDPVTLTLTADPETQTVSDSVTLTAVVQDQEGTWVPSTVITFGTAFDLGDGNFSWLTATTDTNGQAFTTVSSTLQGLAEFTATTTNGITDTAQVDFVAANKIEVGISQSTLAPGIEAMVVATVTTPGDEPVPGAEVNFWLDPFDLGGLDPISGTTSSEGVMTTIFTAGELEQQGEIWAQIGDHGDSDSVQVVVEKRRTYLPLVLRNYPPPWVVGSGSTGRTVYHITACPNDAATMYAGSNDSILKSEDGGANWAQTNQSGDYLWAAAVVKDTDCDTVLATVWGEGIRKSTDGGTSWFTPSGDQPPSEVYYVVADSSDPGVLYAATNGQGVYKSTNSGQDWLPAGLGGKTVLYLALDPDDSSQIYASVLGEGIYKSENAATSWNPASDGLTGSKIIFGVSVAPDTGGDVVLASSTDRGVFVTVDGGDNWSRWSELGYDQNVESVLAFEFEGSLVFLAGTHSHGVYRSTDEGASWHLYSSGLTDMRARTLSSAGAVVLEGDYIYLGSGNGAWRRMIVP